MIQWIPDCREAQWNSKKEELRYVEQTEVLQADHQGPVWRNQMIAKKNSLILEIDALRIQISAAKQNEGSHGTGGSVLDLPWLRGSNLEFERSPSHGLRLWKFLIPPEWHGHPKTPFY
jgi:hypothetical protein